MSPMQSVQNTADRLVTGTRHCDHITPVLCLLHWLPVRQRVNFKVVTLVHCPEILRRTYVADDCPDPQQLR